MMGKRKHDRRDRSPRQHNERPERSPREPHQRHPPHLKGKAIGLFYAKHSQAKKEQDKKRPLGSVSLSPEKREEIEATLNSTVVKNFFFDKDGSYKHVKDSQFKREFLRVISETIDDNLMKATVDIMGNTELDEKYQKEHSLKQSNQRYREMLKQRKKLPAFNMKEEILGLVSENDVVVISGETGCGKTTQVAQFILDDFLEKGKGSECRVLCTQPRRISAISVAQRVADERAESLGISVGYQIRLERRLPRDRASICFCTTGVVLKVMESDAALSSVSHLILDEIHERDVMSDFILALIKKIKKRRKDLKVILMSATLNAEKFSKYYDDAPHVNIPGFTFPVQEFYLEDVLLRTGFEYDEKYIPQKKLAEYSKFIGPHVRLLEQSKQYNRQVCKQLRNPLCEEINIKLIFSLLVNICQKEEEQGAILVFLTGFAEISNLSKIITESGLFPPDKYLIFPLHSLMPTLEQKQIFETPPEGKRKIILATNIAETSITIDDVVYVIDCGKIKLTDFKAETNSDILAPQWVSLANANQRRGRAGRVKPGVCFHLFSKARNMVLEQYQLPEILRKRLEDVILTAKVLQLGKVALFFAELIDCPDPESVALAITLLKRMNALTEDEKLTPLGYHLAKLPMAPQMGKMILFGAIFSCLDPILSVATTLDYKDPFVLPIGREKQVNEVKLQLSDGSDSDHLLFHEVLKGFERSTNPRQYCWQHFLSYQTLAQLLEMKKQFMQYLYEMNFVATVDSKDAQCNRNSDNVCLVKAIICAGLYPNVAISRQLGKQPAWTPDMRYKLDIHPKSIVGNCTYFGTNILVYYRKMRSTSDYIHDCTLIHPLPIIFFGDKFEQVEEEHSSRISINGNMKFLCRRATSSIIKELRHSFNLFLEYKIAHPGPVFWTEDNSNNETKILEVIMELITCAETESEGRY